MAQLKHIGIIGLGLIGGSIAKSIKASNKDIFVSAYDPNKDSLLYAKEKGMINASADIEQLAKKCNLIVIAVPINLVSSIAQQIAEAANPDRELIVIDTASVKSKISTKFASLSSEKQNFIATHPFAGTEFSGVQHARKHLFRAKPWIICPNKNVNPESIKQVTEFIQLLGARPIEMGAKRHDELAAAASHATILVSNLWFKFVHEMYPEALEVAGSGFDSTTRQASGNPLMHAQIMKENHDTIIDMMREFTAYITDKTSADKVATLNEEQTFKANQEARNNWLKSKSQ